MFYFYQQAFLNAVNLSMSLGRAKSVQSLKKVIFLPALIGFKGAVPVSDKKIDRNYETRISVTTHPKKSFHERFYCMNIFMVSLLAVLLTREK